MRTGRCEQCDWYAQTGTGEFGECRATPPGGLANSDVVTVYWNFPLVHRDDWCSAWSAMEDGA